MSISTFPAKAVTEVAENYPRPEDETENRRRRWQNATSVPMAGLIWEKFTVKDQRSGNTVEQKVIPVDDGACDYLKRRGGRLGYEGSPRCGEAEIRGGVHVVLSVLVLV